MTATAMPVLFALVAVISTAWGLEEVSDITAGRDESPRALVAAEAVSAARHRDSAIPYRATPPPVEQRKKGVVADPKDPLALRQKKDHIAHMPMPQREEATAALGKVTQLMLEASMHAKQKEKLRKTMLAKERTQKKQEHKDYTVQASEIRRKNQIYHNGQQAIAQAAQKTSENVQAVYDKERAHKSNHKHAMVTKAVKYEKDRRGERRKKREVLYNKRREKRAEKRDKRQFRAQEKALKVQRAQARGRPHKHSILHGCSGDDSVTDCEPKIQQAALLKAKAQARQKRRRKQRARYKAKLKAKERRQKQGTEPRRYSAKERNTKAALEGSAPPHVSQGNAGNAAKHAPPSAEKQPNNN